MRDLLDRIVHSKKAAYLAVPMMVNTVASLFGVDIRTPLLLALDLGFATLAVFQFILDLRWGSKSDGTAVRVLPLLLAVGLLAGCGASLKLGPERFRVIEVQGNVAESICWRGFALGAPMGEAFLGLDMEWLGWGSYLCTDIEASVETTAEELPGR